MTNVVKIADENVTAVEITFPWPKSWGDEQSVAVGTARRSPEDAYDKVVGEQLAHGRALIALGKALVEAGHARSRESKPDLTELLRASIDQRLREGIFSYRDTRTEARKREEAEARIFGLGDRQLTAEARRLGLSVGICGQRDCGFDMAYRNEIRNALFKEAGLA